MPRIGRPGYQSENKTREIIDKSIPIIKQALDRKGIYKDLAIETVVDLAKTFVLKAIPDGGKNDSGKITIYLINQDSPELQSNSIEILPSQIATDNPAEQK